MDNKYLEIYDKLPDKHKILFHTIEPKKILEISTIIKKSKGWVSNSIQRKESEQTLLAKNQIHKVTVDGDAHYWQTTDQGIKVLDRYLEIKKRRDEEEDKNIYTQKKRNERIVHYMEFLDQPTYSTIVANAIENKGIVSIDCQDLIEFDFQETDHLIDNPDEHIDCLREAIKQNTAMDHVDVWISLFNIPSTENIKIGHIRKEDPGRLIVVEGIVKQASKPKQKSYQETFECPACGQSVSIIQTSKHMIEPKKCSACGFKGKFHHDESKSVKRDFQVLQVEEQLDGFDGRSAPIDMHIYLYDQLVGKDKQAIYNPGSTIRVIGIVRAPYKETTKGKLTEADTYIEAVTTQALDDLIDFSMSEEDQKNIDLISSKQQPIEYLIDHISPGIYGNRAIKLAMLCQLVGASVKDRDKIHVLLVGDPSLAKTKMASSVLDILPKSQKIGASNASGVGITASVVKDEFSGDWSVRAGALPLCDGGIAIIDELDKMEDKNQLAEPMESMTVSVHKAGISTTMSARVSVLATANPKYSRFTTGGSIYDEINLRSWLISRFDLIFVLVDTKEHDKELSKFLLHMQTGEEEEEEQNEALDRSVLRKYIWTAAKLQPKFSKKTLDMLQKSYLAMRSTEEYKNISPRQLMGLSRIASAIAKLRMSKKVEEQDVAKAVELFKDSLRSLGVKDIDALLTGIGSEDRNKMQSIVALFDKKEEWHQDEIASTLKISEKECADLVGKLKQRGDIYEPKRKNWRRV